MPTLYPTKPVFTSKTKPTSYPTKPTATSKPKPKEIPVWTDTSL